MQEKTTYLNMENLKLRMLSYLDFKEFKSACSETQQSMESFLELGIIIKDIWSLDYWNLFAELMGASDLDNFGVFDGKTLISHGMVTESYFASTGVQIVGWTRASYQNQHAALFGLIKLTQRKLGQGFRFIELIIDRDNLASRRAAERAGYKLVAEIPALGQGRNQSGRYCLYMFFSNQLKLVSSMHDMDPLDLLDHPGVDAACRHLLYDNEINDFYKWIPLPS
jgi:RimJ/RimL family protein N-acetyltransferase